MYLCESNTNDDDSNSSANTNDIDRLMNQGELLRQLREIEKQDEKERMKQRKQEVLNVVLSNGQHYNSNDDEQISHNNNGVHREQQHDDDNETIPLSNGYKLLLYDIYLNHQGYYDDLKHIDYQYIDYGNIDQSKQLLRNNIYNEKVAEEVECHLIMEQDKTLGKGGFCWDAAYILGEYVIQSLLASIIDYDDDRVLTNQQMSSSQQIIKRRGRITIIELGCGTGLCGMMIAKALPNITHVIVTDIDKLIPLIQRNIIRNFNISTTSSGSTHHVDTTTNNNNNNDDILLIRQHEPKSVKKSIGMIQSSILEWGTVHEDQYNTYDIIIGSDVVSTLYDPIALANTIYKLCHKTTSLNEDYNNDDNNTIIINNKKDNNNTNSSKHNNLPISIVYISFKERLSTIHRIFEKEMIRLFHSVIFAHPKQHKLNNHNHDRTCDDGDKANDHVNISQEEDNIHNNNNNNTNHFSSSDIYFECRNHNPDVHILIATGPKMF